MDWRDCEGRFGYRVKVLLHESLLGLHEDLLGCVQRLTDAKMCRQFYTGVYEFVDRRCR
jgi:hypothetical protein